MARDRNHIGAASDCFPIGQKSNAVGRHFWSLPRRDLSPGPGRVRKRIGCRFYGLLQNAIATDSGRPHKANAALSQRADIRSTCGLGLDQRPPEAHPL